MEDVVDRVHTGRAPLGSCDDLGIVEPTELINYGHQLGGDIFRLRVNERHTRRWTVKASHQWHLALPERRGSDRNAGRRRLAMDLHELDSRNSIQTR
jgi:hypothetical protein